MKKKNEDSCYTCRFWIDGGCGVDGQCRRHPPRIVDAAVEKDLRSGEWAAVREEMWHYTVWPETLSADWCGEHERKQ